MADVGLFDNILSMNEKHGKRGQWIGLFLLDSAKHVSSYLEFGNKETSNRIIYPVEVYK